MKKIIALLLSLLTLTACTRIVKVEDVKVAEDEWGLTLSAENVTPSGMTIVFKQMNGKQTGELQTGDWYALYKEEAGEWKEVPYAIEDGVNVGWHSIAYMIPKGGSYEMEVNWEWLYGKLAPGKYRINKEVMDFRETGDFDEKIYSLEFTVSGKAEVALYFPDKDVMNLEKEVREIDIRGSIEKSILHELMKGPESEELNPSLYGNITVISVATKDGLCTIDLSSDFTEYNTGGSTKEYMAIMSIVKSLCELEGIERVKINIEGEENPQFGGHFTLEEPFSPNGI
ncbi:MAG: GerMN domain-containing protein [Clostridia bacterium]|nr:GerMN domain-containing protein [Clostridia bacterium]